jgi:glycosyltransferase involved in cell wall biosynthesis
MVGGQETGNETYITGLIGALQSSSPEAQLLVFNVGSPWSEPSAQVRFQRLLTGNPFLRLGVELPIRSLTQHLDVLHMTYSAPVWSAAPLVLTVHDICYATNPEWFSKRDLRVLNAMVPRSIRMAAHVITDSESARRQIIDYYGVREDKISAVPIGPGPAAMAVPAADAKREIAALGLPVDRPYLLTVGNLQPRKNLVRLIEAYSTVALAGEVDADLVIVGPRRFRADDVVAAAAGLRGRIHLTGYLSDRQLAACYSLSAGFVLPSLYEGFGLPILEAMSHGVPVASSNGGALPEVCGDAALMFDALSVPDIAGALKALRSEPLRSRLAEAGRARASEFSWVRTARLTLDIYRKAASG